MNGVKKYICETSEGGSRGSGVGVASELKEYLMVMLEVKYKHVISISQMRCV